MFLPQVKVGRKPYVQYILFEDIVGRKITKHRNITHYAGQHNMHASITLRIEQPKVVIEKVQGKHIY